MEGMAETTESTVEFLRLCMPLVKMQLLETLLDRPLFQRLNNQQKGSSLKFAATEESDPLIRCVLSVRDPVRAPIMVVEWASSSHNDPAQPVPFPLSIYICLI